LFHKIRDGYFLGHKVDHHSARLMKILQPGVWDGHLGSAARTYRHEDFSDLIRKKIRASASSVSGSFGSPFPFLVWFSCHLLRVGYTVTGYGFFRVLAVSITAVALLFLPFWNNIGLVTPQIYAVHVKS
jgi:hypothetical protein